MSSAVLMPDGDRAVFEFQCALSVMAEVDLSPGKTAMSSGKPGM